MTLPAPVFPFDPYPAQQRLMQRVSEVLARRQHAIVESPTGTGKSLMIWFTAYNWLRELRQAGGAGKAQEGVAEKKLPAWMRERISELTRSEALENALFVQSALQNMNETPPERLTEMMRDSGALFEPCGSAGGCVVYASKTHLQLQQTQQLFKQSGLSTAVVAGRAVYCVHPQREIQDIEDLDQFCKNSACACRDAVKINQFALDVLRQGYDFQQTAQQGDARRICPYYAQKAAALAADVVFITHNSLVDELARPRVLRRPNTVVFCDEAHGLFSVAESSLSVALPLQSISEAAQALSSYLAASQDVLRIGDLQMLYRVHAFVAKLAAVFKRAAEAAQSSQRAFAAQSTVPAASASPQQDSASQQQGSVLHGPALAAFMADNKLQPSKEENSALLADLDAFTEGRFPYRVDSTKYSLLYRVVKLCRLVRTLDPANFALILQNGQIKLACVFFSLPVRSSARLLLFGGTLKPFSSLRRLFCGLDFQELEGDHIIQPRQLQVYMSNTTLFSLQHQTDANLRRVLDLTRSFRTVMPANQCIAVFLPSKRVLAQLQRIGDFSAMTAIFESRTAMQSLQSASNAVLFGVMGGQLSEGMDFKDDLCRLLIIVGIPFQNISDPLVQLRSEAKEYAFRVVNQTIGRLIRWRGDYGAVILLDSRFQAHIGYLSKWIQASVKGTYRGGQSTSKDVAALQVGSSGEPQDPKDCVKMDLPSEAQVTALMRKHGF